ncbi:MAG: hypothetical protein BUE48_004045 [Thermomonospora sp. CIF 1]|nr:MAG: hypothetical protein BUE48_004045 [Thermomonospora sp. CIF 1]
MGRVTHSRPHDADGLAAPGERAGSREPAPRSAGDFDELEEFDEPEAARPQAVLEELRRQEAERRARRRRRDAVSRKVVGWIVAAALALLLHDSVRALRRAVSAGDPWGEHAAVAVAAALGLVWLLAVGIRALRRR